ncbi:hypothetical protein [Amycolatopsis sp. NPDC059657]|uniref:hypothetical protein n=1 Tax=Amycolatopsis sp. NPDC059657 TaxID=3346899 RepID=UPI00366D280E
MNERKRVTVTRASASARPRQYPVRQEIDEETDIGGLYVGSLIRAQLRLGITVCLAVGGTLAAIPALFWIFPAVREVRLFGIGLPWLLLGVLVYPFVVLVAWILARCAERKEREFAEMVDRL